MASNKKEVTEKAMRIYMAIEKNKKSILGKALDHEKNVDELSEVDMALTRFEHSFQIMENLLINILRTESGQRTEIDEKRHLFINKALDLSSELEAKLRNPDIKYAFRNLYFDKHTWDEILVWLEIDSEIVQNRYEELAHLFKIPYDKNDKLWVQKIHDENSRRIAQLEKKNKGDTVK
ncbi:MAG: hypothetical protein Q8L41_09800 [Anaerolineales bacterium]|nr:hypothetical protein [Anaerolineales bacterium]